MTSEHLTAVLAEKIMGWGVAPDRLLLGDRRWLPRWRFQPLTKLEHALQLVEKAATSYTLTVAEDGTFAAHVRIGERTGIASGEPKAMAITVAVARAIGLDVQDQVVGENR